MCFVRCPRLFAHLLAPLQGFKLYKLKKLMFFVFQTNFKKKTKYKNALNIGDGSRVVTAARINPCPLRDALIACQGAVTQFLWRADPHPFFTEAGASDV